MIRSLVSRLINPHTYDNEHFVKYLESKGAKIGKNTRFISPSKSFINTDRADYITIGDNCCLSVVSIIAHDYSWYVLLDAVNDVCPDPGGEVVIGNNCFVGFQSCILMDTHIGDNVIIGARSVVKGDIPSNTVWAGVPAKQICTLEEYHNKKIKNKERDALYRRNHLKSVLLREPTIEEMGGVYPCLFLERTEENYDKWIKQLSINGVKGKKELRDYFFSSKPLFSNWEEFMRL